MKSLRFVLCIGLVALMTCGTASIRAHAEEDLPPPQDTGGGGAPLPNSPPPQEIPTTDEDSLPAMGGQEDLPAPSLGEGKEDPANQVNNGMEEDNVFLPTPQASDEANYSAPMDPAYSNYNNSSRTFDEQNWRTGMNSRPIFNLYMGMASRNFISGNIGGGSIKTGPNLGFSIRLFDLGQTVFLHGYLDAINFKVGDIITNSSVSAISGVNVFTHRYGGILEIGVGRRVSLFGTLLRTIDLLTADPIQENVTNPDVTFYDNVAQPPTWKLGLGIAYDFYVIPHGSLGVRGHVEKDMFTITLSMALEPIPKKRLAL